MLLGQGMAARHLPFWPYYSNNISKPGVIPYLEVRTCDILHDNTYESKKRSTDINVTETCPAETNSLFEFPQRLDNCVVDDNIDIGSSWNKCKWESVHR